MLSTEIFLHGDGSNSKQVTPILFSAAYSQKRLTTYMPCSDDTQEYIYGTSLYDAKIDLTVMVSLKESWEL